MGGSSRNFQAPASKATAPLPGMPVTSGFMGTAVQRAIARVAARQGAADAVLNSAPVTTPTALSARVGAARDAAAKTRKAARSAVLGKGGSY